jgi:two-component system phosphate regulon sensor histidine kinase PhoR
LKLGIRAKLFFLSFGLIVLTVGFGYSYMATRLEQVLVENVRSDLEVRARLIALNAAQQSGRLRTPADWDALANELGARGDARVTFIRQDGTVLGDSEVATDRLQTLDNHADRPEVVDAVKHGTGSSKRNSRTVGSDMLYVAVPFAKHTAAAGVARVAVPLRRVQAGLAQLKQIVTVAAILALAFAVVVSTAAAHAAARPARALTSAARRMAAGDLSTRTKLRGGDEFGELGRALDQVAESLSTTVGELRRERDRLSGILTGMQEGVLMLDEAGRVAVINPALREMLLLGADAVGKTPLELIRHADLKDVLDAARSGETQPVSAEIELGGLKPRRLLVRAAPVAGNRGIFAVFVDVTEVRRLESMRRDFVANVSHELRTPVTAIRSAAETLKCVAADDRVAADMFVDIIERNAERLHGLVEDLLDLSRIESRAYKLKLEPVDIGAVFAQVVSLFGERAQKRNVRIVVEDTSSLATVRADRRALEHVITNLVDNAVKYCGAGAAVRLRASDSDAAVRVVVEDDGPGIDSQHLPRLFERFYRVDAGRSRELGGTGLGLSIVKHMVEAMGSAVSVESQIGQGTRFTFSLRKWGAELRRDSEATATLH